MKEIRPSVKLAEKLEALKSHAPRNKNLSSKIIAVSRALHDDSPEYYIRVDWPKDMKDHERLLTMPTAENETEDTKHIEYWQIRNTDQLYFTDLKNRISSMKELLETEKRLGIETSNKYKLKELQRRYNLHSETRLISHEEMCERIEREYILLLK